MNKQVNEVTSPNIVFMLSAYWQSGLLDHYTVNGVIWGGSFQKISGILGWLSNSQTRRPIDTCQCLICSETHHLRGLCAFLIMEVPLILVFLLIFLLCYFLRTNTWLKQPIKDYQEGALIFVCFMLLVWVPHKGAQKSWFFTSDKAQGTQRDAMLVMAPRLFACKASALALCINCSYNSSPVTGICETTVRANTCLSAFLIALSWE